MFFVLSQDLSALSQQSQRQHKQHQIAINEMIITIVSVEGSVVTRCASSFIGVKITSMSKARGLKYIRSKSHQAA